MESVFHDSLRKPSSFRETISQVKSLPWHSEHHTSKLLLLRCPFLFTLLFPASWYLTLAGLPFNTTDFFPKSKQDYRLLGAVPSSIPCSLSPIPFWRLFYLCSRLYEATQTSAPGMPISTMCHIDDVHNWSNCVKQKIGGHYKVFLTTSSIFYLSQNSEDYFHKYSSFQSILSSFTTPSFKIKFHLDLLA